MRQDLRLYDRVIAGSIMQMLDMTVETAMEYAALCTRLAHDTAPGALDEIQADAARIATDAVGLGLALNRGAGSDHGAAAYDAAVPVYALLQEVAMTLMEIAQAEDRATAHAAAAATDPEMVTDVLASRAFADDLAAARMAAAELQAAVDRAGV